MARRFQLLRDRPMKSCGNHSPLAWPTHRNGAVAVYECRNCLCRAEERPNGELAWEDS